MWENVEGGRCNCSHLLACHPGAGRDLGQELNLDPVLQLDDTKGMSSYWKVESS